MVYGYLRKSGGGNFKVEVYVLDVGQGVIEAETAVPVSAADLSSDRIDRTATEIVNSLYPDETDGDTPTPLPIGEEGTDPSDEPVVRDKPKRESDYVWGRYKPRPKWKWAGFGVGLGLTVAGVVTVGLGAPRIAAGGPLERDLFKAADDSLVDVIPEGKPGAGELNTENDIDRSQGGDLCALAEAPPPGEPDRVTNRNVATVCRKARHWTIATNIGIAAIVVGAITTITFTTLLFVHKDKEKQPSDRRARRQGRPRLLRLDAAPARGGVLVTGTGRF
jgi:hypothetical protein